MKLLKLINEINFKYPHLKQANLEQIKANKNKTPNSKTTQLLLAVIFTGMLLITTEIHTYAATIKSTVYKVATDNLNFRKKASTSSATLGTLKKNTKLTYIKTKTDSAGQRWYKVKAKVGKSTKKGYVYADYITKTDTYEFYKRLGYVKQTNNVYKSTSTGSNIVCRIKANKKAYASSLKKVNGTKWYKITFKKGKKTYKGYIPASQFNLYKITAKTAYNKNYYATSAGRLYQTANVNSPLKTKFTAGTDILVLNTLTVNNVNWQKAKINVNGTIQVGYVKASVTKVATKKKTSKQNFVGTTIGTAVLRNKPNDAAKALLTVKTPTTINVTATYSVHGKTWYYGTIKIDNTTYTGYISMASITTADNAVVQAQIATFPASYQAALQELHLSYPNWKFVPIQTGLDWADVIAGESVVKKNTISSTVPTGGTAGTYSAPFSYLSTAGGAYDWSTDTYTLCDGSTWYTASEAVVKYYMDPRNFLNEKGIFQFEALAYDSSQSKTVVSSILADTFMSETYTYTDPDTKNVVTHNYADTFMTAGERSGVSPYHLATRAKQELGLNGSGSVTGTYPGYVGYYNYYNIGANDSAGGGAIANGLNYAKTGTTYLRPWNTPYKAILGGADYIGASYINRGQNTLYLQKFNVTNATSGLYSHQYMTNVQAPTSEASNLFESYKELGIINDVMVFYIPVYENMPATACSLPAKKGNPNSYIKSLTIKDQDNGGLKKYLTSTGNSNGTFNYLTTAYTLTIDSSVKTVTFNPKPVSSYASITNTELTYNVESLVAGASKTINIACKAGDGTTTTYTFKIVRAAS